MAYYLTGREYIQLISDALGSQYLNGYWHSEDIGTAVEFANSTIERTLGSLNDNGSRFRWKRQSSEGQSS